ncbi:tripartite tricarboxylate transporter TctB family protein [Virgibacillus salexigens]|uniref:Tripartite tricarboxylate transporter TctB family protein n=1 Tax=Virgibacillus massiliensis TaxID=1462526 RepID=A0A024QEE6_9BACI|nr:tripartite tricarboxylate transporter TctB family protein [Virgibacillus massiliensis]CDQ40874.1 Tripartite tricarboxylate transporter TctB family protein [Virgibacillus massiliensis]
MKAFKIGMPIFLILLSVFFLVGSLRLPKANLGNPYGPLYFPIGVSLLLLIFSIIYFIQELRKLTEDNEAIKELFSGRTPKLIGITILFAIGYSLLFERAGFLLSSILFLGALLFLINGPKKWITNLIVAVIFSFISWYAFSEMLGVSLP